MKNTKPLLTILALWLCFGLFAQNEFYTPEGKIHLETSTEKVLIKFKSNVDFEGQKQILAIHDNLIPLKEEDLLPSPLVTIAKLSSGTDKAAVNNLLSDLRTNSDIEYAHPFLQHEDGTLQGIMDKFIVGLKDEFDIDMLANLAMGYGAEIEKQSEFNPLQVHLRVTQNSDQNALQIANVLFETGLFEFAEPDFLRLMKRLNTNDPFVGDQWSLDNDGNNTSQWNGIAGADMNVFNAWSTTTGSSSIKVAILDEGVDLVHPDLVANLLPGYDATGQGSGGGPSGDDAHGTACAGIVASVGNNNTGTVGVAYGSKIIPVRIAYSNAAGNWVTSNAIIADAINWSWQTANADILSNSWGGGSSSTAINNAINGAITSGRGGLGAPVLFAAGNGNGAVGYPGSNNQTIAVIAMSMCNERKNPSSCDGESWWGSDHGTNADIAAPGVKIYATDISGPAGYSSGDYTATFNGTSSACPNAAGVMALILSFNGSLTEQEARAAIETTCDKVGGYTYSTVSGQPNGTWSTDLGYGRVNANAALNSLTPPTNDDAGISAIADPSGIICAASSIPDVTLKNYGLNNLTSVDIEYSVDGGSVATYAWTGNLASQAATSVMLPSISFSGGSHTFNVNTSNPNGMTDTKMSNDAASSTFSSGEHGVTVTILTDNYGSETTWDIKDSGGSTLASGGPYNQNNTTFTHNLCLPSGCLDFTIYDSYGDGICCSFGNGSYSVIEDATGTSLASGGTFGSSETTNFCLVPAISCTWTVLDEEGFESNWGIWNDGGEDCRRALNDSPYANNGSYCIRLRDDDPNSSFVTTNVFDYSNYDELQVDFSFITKGFEVDEDFWLQISLDGGSTFTTVQSWARGTDFNNDERHDPSVNIPGPFTANTVIRFRCNSSHNGDNVYLDDIKISECSPALTCTYGIDDVNTFEVDWGMWNDGGDDCRRDLNDQPYASSGSYCIRLRDNDPNSSFMTTNVLDYSAYDELTVDFSFITKGFEINEDFWLQISTDGGSTFTTIKSWARGTDFNNEERHNPSVAIPGPFTANTVIRFRCNSSDHGDNVYLDDVKISVCGNNVSSCTFIVDNDENFDANWGMWNDGGDDCRRDLNDQAYANSGSYCIRLRDDDPNSSFMTTNVLDYLNYLELTVDFSFITKGFEIGEDFWLQISLDGGSTFTTVQSWARGTDFNNDERHNPSVNIPGPFTSNTVIRFRCNSSHNGDNVYLDDVKISGCGDFVPTCPFTEDNNENFDTNWGMWNDGGDDCRRDIKDQAYANSGSYCIRLRDDDPNSSFVTSNVLDYSGTNDLRVDFSFITKGFEVGEDFWLQISTDGGSTYTTVQSWARGTDFNNDERHNPSVVIPGPFTANTVIRFRCNSSHNGDNVYLDDIVINICDTGGVGAMEMIVDHQQDENSLNQNNLIDDNITQLILFPNPVQNELTIRFKTIENQETLLLVSDFSGRILNQISTEGGIQERQLDVHDWAPGFYLVQLISGDQKITQKFIVTK